MKPINFEQCNVIYTAPNCDDLPVYKTDESLISCWEPDDEELEYIKQCILNNEKPKFILEIAGQLQPPVYVGCNI